MQLLNAKLWEAKRCREDEMKGKGLDFGTVCIIIVVVGVVGLCIFGAVQTYRSREAAGPFRDMEAQAREACARCLSGSPEAASDPYLRGKVLTVEASSGEVIGLTMADLASEISAAQPEEVSTLVCAGDVEEMHVSTYEDGEAAYKLRRQFCIYDLVQECTILVETLYGGSPPYLKSAKGPGSGSDPAHRELIALLEQLPIR
jgi:hypothetical protein